MDLDSRIFIAGHTGLAGPAILRRLEAGGFSSVLTAGREQFDIRDRAAFTSCFRANRPEFIFPVAGTVGGILANSTRPAEFVCDNMMIHATVDRAAHLCGSNDSFALESSHGLPAMLCRFHEANEAECGEVVPRGTGAPLREPLHVDDLADACLFPVRGSRRVRTPQCGNRNRPDAPRACPDRRHVSVVSRPTNEIASPLRGHPHAEH